MWRSAGSRSSSGRGRRSRRKRRHVPTKRELCMAEERAWQSFAAALARIPNSLREEVGYYPDWSVKDMVGHIGCWHAEAVQILEQIRMDTFVRQRLDVDEMNRRFVEALRDQPVQVVKVECAASRTRFLQEFDLLETVTPDAEEWFVESGAAHYEEHVSRLVEWAEELAARSQQ